MPPATLRYWVHGRTTSRSGGEPVVSRPLISAPAGADNRLSFNDLVEAHVLRALRAGHRIPVAAVREAIVDAERALGITCLLLSDELRTSGQDLFLDRLCHLVKLSRSGRLALRQLLRVHLQRVDRDEEALPCRFYPLRPGWSAERRPIAIDPRVSFGRPTVAGSGVSTAALVDRYDAGETLQALAHDYRLKISQIEDAVFFETLQS